MTDGQSYPLGATVHTGGVNFSIFSKFATGMELLLFDDVDDRQPSHVVALDPRWNRTYHYWHVFVPGVRAGQVYAYRADGPWDPARGLRFDRRKVLLDPYSRCVAVGEHYRRGDACGQPPVVLVPADGKGGEQATLPLGPDAGDNAATAMKSVVADFSTYDWEGDRRLHRPFSNTVIYELHVRGFTQNPNCNVAPEKRGTYAGLVEKIPYLQELGVTAVELLPVYQFDSQDAPPGKTNYWGYSPVSFFAPHAAYSSRKDPLGTLDEFRDMVKALHRAGIEVILDVVYNHTTEGNENGPTLCYRGLANETYYILERDRTYYSNYTGCGNTLNSNQPVVRRMIVDSLHHWVSEMHVDGFRFDLASILSRDESGCPLANPPVLWDIESDPVMAGTKLIAEAWDAAGLYQVGSFVGDSWKEWNGKFRDDVRSFFRGDPGTAARLPNRLLGSPDLYAHKEREPEQSINFVTCHDGFTLNDLVSYNGKHNEANGEQNRDGNNDNLSWNCGMEGPGEDPDVEQLRDRQVKNLLAVNLLSVGAPMIMMGDEVRRTQQGNNNAYCQDNELSWFDWELPQKHASIHRFVARLIRLRLNFDWAQQNLSISLPQYLAQAGIEWHGVKLHQPDWSEGSRTLAVTALGLMRKRIFHLILSAYWEPLEFDLPPMADGSPARWRRIIDTFQPSPHDLCFWDHAPPVDGPRYTVQPRSVVLLGAEIAATILAPEERIAGQ
jgi:isoamylase